MSRELALEEGVLSMIAPVVRARRGVLERATRGRDAELQASLSTLVVMAGRKEGTRR